MARAHRRNEAAAEEAAQLRARAGVFSPVGAGPGTPARGMPAIGDLGDLMMAYLEFMQADAKDKDKFLLEWAHIKVGLPFKPFAREPSDLITFSKLHEIVCKIIHVLMVGSLYCANEDIGTTAILRAFECHGVVRSLVTNCCCSENSTSCCLIMVSRALREVVPKP